MSRIWGIRVETEVGRNIFIRGETVPGYRDGGWGRQKIKEGSKMREAGGVMLVYSVEGVFGTGGAEL